MRAPRIFPGSASSELLRHMFGFRCQNRGRVSMSINWPESWYGRLRRATASTVVNTAVLPPIPNARVMAAIAVKPGLRRRNRPAYRRSCHHPASIPPCDRSSCAAMRAWAASISRASSRQLANCASARCSASASEAPPARASNCGASSATISLSRSGGTCRCGKWPRTYWRQSGMVEPRQPVEGVRELSPVSALLGQCAPTLRGEAVEAAPAFARLLHPTAFHQSLTLQAVQHGVERHHVELELVVRFGLDELGRSYQRSRLWTGQEACPTWPGPGPRMSWR